VVIDRNPTPLENIVLLQPDFFAKGYEYTAAGLPPKTQEEVDALKAYGGEMLFTPGDIVYSSTRLIDLAPPSIKSEKLLTFMDSEGLTFDTLRAALAKLGKYRVHVVGDTIVDSYTQTAMVGGQTKTPTMSVLYERRDDYIGGAAVVAEHLRAAGAEVVFSTVLGDDSLKDFVLEGLKKRGVDCRAIIDRTRPTTSKNAIVAGGYRLLKIDTLDNRSISDENVAKLAAAVREVPTDAVVFSDFRHGVFNRRTIPRLEEAIPAGRFKVADSQVASRWGNITEFKGFDLITPNEREARFALADQDSGIRPLASSLYDAAQCKTLILKLGERGVLTCRSNDHESLDSFIVVDSFADRVVDAVGAGDALLAYATLAKIATGSDAIATILGSMAAACECEMDGNVPVTPEDVGRKIDMVEQQANYNENRKS
jgi:rfaE bifunctional protein kinase chain/domain